MKIACIMGSPRKDGNSASIAQSFIETAEARGASVQTFYLNDLSFKGCQACMKCKTAVEKCVVSDALAPVLEAVTGADILLMASPVYFGQITGQLKCFIDRTYSFLKPDYMTNNNPSRLNTGKKCVFVLTQGNPNTEMYADVYTNYATFLKWFGYEMHCIRGIGMIDRTDAEHNETLIGETRDLARSLIID